MFYILIFVSSIFSLVYELILSTVSSYLIGNSVMQFSLTIGMFLGGLGIGSYLAQFIRFPLRTFLYLEIVLAFLGGFSVVLLKALFLRLGSYDSLFVIIYFTIALLIGIITGLEPLLLARQLDQDNKAPFGLLSDVLGIDYLGSILATFLFPFILLPFLGLSYTTLAMGVCNWIIIFVFIAHTRKDSKQHLAMSIMLCLSWIGLAFASWQGFDARWDHFFYNDAVIYSEQTPYQHIIMTKHDKDIRLYLDGNLQFMSLDEQRYHEALRNPIQKHLSGSPIIPKILILGGGDGLLVRTIKKYHPEYSGNIQLIELDPAMIQLAKENTVLTSLNKNALKDINISNQDAYNFLIKNPEQYDAIICDFPDPRDIGLAKLYSKEIYGLIANRLTNQGVFVTHAGNAFFMREVFWTIHHTIKSTEKFSDIVPYHTYIPSFGDRGFITAVLSGTIHDSIDNPLIQKKFDPDYLYTPTCTNSLDTPCIIFEYQKGEKRFEM